MERRLFLLVILIVYASICSCAQKRGNKEIAVAFYNCENFFDTIHEAGKEDEDFTPGGKFHYTEKIYHQKLHNIASVIQKLGDNPSWSLSVMGMAEVENNHVLDDLISQPEIKASHYKYVWYDGPDARGINVALLYNPRLFQVLHSEALHVNLSGTGAKETTRDVLHVYGILNNDTVHVFVNHWPSRRGEEGESVRKRTIAATVVKRYTDSLLNTDSVAKVIVMGDFNDNPTDACITQVLGAKSNKNDAVMKDLFNPWGNLYEGGEGTLEYKHHWDLFDQIIISGAFLHASHKLFFDKARIFKPDFLVDHYKQFNGYPHRSFAGTHWINGYSDHFPVVLLFGRR